MDASADIPNYGLYGEPQGLPDLLHCETIGTRARPHDWQINLHLHQGLHQVFLFQSGGGVMTCDGVQTQITGDLLISIPARVVHGFSFHKGTEGYVLTLPLANFTTHGLDRPLQLTAGADIAAIIALIARHHAHHRPGREGVLQGLAGTLLALIRQDISTRALRHDLPAHLVAFDAAVSRGLSAQRQVSDFAADLGLTPTHLTRLCRRYWGKSASAIIEERRMDEAKRLLVYTRLTIAETAETLGYLDPAYFSRAFKRSTGKPPNAYRAQFAAL